MHVVFCLFVLFSSCSTLEDNYVPIEDLVDSYHEEYKDLSLTDWSDAKPSELKLNSTTSSPNLEDVKGALQRILFDRVLDEFTTPPVKVQTRQIRDNKHRDGEDKETAVVGHQSQDMIQTELQLEQQENLKNQIVSEYQQISDVVTPVTNANKDPADLYHFWEKDPNHLGLDFDLQKEKKPQKGSVHDFGKWYNYFLDDSIGMAKPPEFIDENWNNDYNRDKSIHDVLKDIQKSKKENFDKLNKLVAQKSFLQDIPSDYDIPDYFKNRAKPPQSDVANSTQVQEFYLQVTASTKVENTEGNKEDSAMEVEADYRRVLEIKRKHEKLKKRKGNVTKETIETYPTFNFEPKYFTLPARWPSKLSKNTKDTTSTKQRKLTPENLHPTIAQYYEPPNLYPIITMSKTTMADYERNMAKLRNNLIDENAVVLSKQDNEYIENGTWNVKLDLENKPIHTVALIDSEPDTPSPSTEIKIIQSETEPSIPKNDELEPTILNYYQHQNFSVKILRTKTKAALRSSTSLPLDNIHLGIVVVTSPTEAHVIRGTTHLTYESSDLPNGYSDLMQESVQLGVFKPVTEGTTIYSRTKPVHLGMFNIDTEGTTARSSIKPVNLGIFEAHNKLTTSQSKSKSMRFGVNKNDTKRITAHSRIEPIHFGIFKAKTKQITAPSSIPSIHLGIFKEHAEETPGSNSCDASIHFGIYKAHTQRYMITIEDKTSTVSSSTATTTTETTTTTPETTTTTPETTTTTISPTQKCYPSTIATTIPDTETTTVFPTFETSTLPTLVAERVPQRDSILMDDSVKALKSRLTAADLVPKPRESNLIKQRSLGPIVDIDKFIPSLIALMQNIIDNENRTGEDLVQRMNETLYDEYIPTCAPEPTTTTRTTAKGDVYTTPAEYDYDGNMTGTIMGKCFVCGMEEKAIPYHAACSDTFSADFMALLPFDAVSNTGFKSYRKYCRYMDTPRIHKNKTDSHSLWGRFTGGCSVRFSDIATVYTQRACRNRHKPMVGKHYASKRMAKLEKALLNVENGCIVSPMATLLPLSRGISIFSKFKACVCTGNWCNKAHVSQYWTNYVAVSSLMVIFNIT